MWNLIKKLWTAAVPEDGYEYYPISQVVHDAKASLFVHGFLYRSPGEEKATGIKVHEGTPEEVEYELGIISIDPAPLIPPQSSTNK